MTTSSGATVASNGVDATIVTDYWNRALENWRQVITEPDEVAVFSALDDPEWDWRTLEGIARDTELKPDIIRHILGKYAVLIRTTQSSKYGVLYQLKNRTTQTDEPLIDRALDFISMGKRRKSA